MTGTAARSILISSEAELDAYLVAFSLTEERTSRRPGDRVLILETVDRDGQRLRLTVQREQASERGMSRRFGLPAVAALDEVMARAAAFSAENPPHHPGTVARFPMPSERFAGCVEIPLAVVARDDGQPGLYAPPRVAVMEWATAEPRGIGEFPGFSADDWPPARVGDWPPASIRDQPPQVIAASVARLSGCLGRLIDEALGITAVSAPSDVSDAGSLIRRLDATGMLPSYRMLSPVFAARLGF